VALGWNLPHNNFKAAEGIEPDKSPFAESQESRCSTPQSYPRSLLSPSDTKDCPTLAGCAERNRRARPLLWFANFHRERKSSGFANIGAVVVTKDANVADYLIPAGRSSGAAHATARETRIGSRAQLPFALVFQTKR